MYIHNSQREKSLIFFHDFNLTLTISNNYKFDVTLIKIQITLLESTKISCY